MHHPHRPGMNERALEALGPWQIEHVVLRIELPADMLTAEVAPRVAVTSTMRVVAVIPGFSSSSGLATPMTTS